jgi:two-component system sensor kinase FixL
MWAGQIIGGLRSFVTRAETKKQPEPVAEIVEEASRLALISARRHGVRIQLHLDSNSDLVLVDRIQIQQVLLNLMLNAVEAMGECDRREITISTRSKGQTIEVSVADTGPGLAPEISAQLFQPFVSTKRNGMGMGLAICRSIIDAHEGDLWSEPNPGEGTIFRFTLRATSVPSGCMVRAPEISSRR